MCKSTNWYCPLCLNLEEGFSINKQAKLRSQGKIPYHKRGNYIRYKRSDIEAWLDEGKVV